MVNKDIDKRIVVNSVIHKKLCLIKIELNLNSLNSVIERLIYGSEFK